jgi:soluble lytic murein transglycosylase-like protein
MPTVRLHRILSVFLLIAAMLIAAEEKGFAAADSSPLSPAALRYGFLSESDVNNYHKIFALQKKERWQDADKVIKKLENDVLMGYVLYQRYMESATWKTKAAEAKSWLKKYSDLPIAGSIHDLATKKGTKLSVPRPANIDNIPAGSCSSYTVINPIDYLYNKHFTYLPKDKRKIASRLMRNIISAINKGKTLIAYNHINSKEAKQLFSKNDMIEVRTALAFLYFTELRDDKALEVMEPILPDAYKNLSISGWVAGLIYWRLGLFEKAAEAFTAAADNPKSRPELVSAASFWAAKVNFKLGNDFVAEGWLEKAAELERYFYGLLARRQLGDEIDHSWQRPLEAEADESTILNKPAVRRAIALFQLGENKKAEDELLKYYYGADNTERSGLLDFAEKNGMPELSQVMISFGKRLENKDGAAERASYPAPKWAPLSGWEIEKALLYAFVRQESCFDNKAVSPAGAKGLMQLMPATAKETADRLNLEWSSKRLFEPAYNLEIGQAYLSRLLHDKFIDGNLIFLAVAYNSGPGNLYRWSKRMDWQGDPLLFIESIPSKQTRSFVQRILGNYWIYSSLFGTEGMNTLDQLIGGFWPMLDY